MASKATGSSEELERYCAALRAAGLDAPWSRPGPLIEQKKTRVETRLWRWAEIEPLLRRTAEFMAPGRGGERRILRIANPGVPERTSTHTISVAIQYLLPGEVAPAHRHTPNAIRFMLRGQGAYTTVDGDKCVMRPGDLVLTPSMTWHDHGNEGTEPVIWLDGLDSPVVRYLEALSMEPYAEPRQAVGVRTGVSHSRYGSAGLRPAWSDSGERSGHLLHYRWEATHEALLRLAAVEASPFDDVMLEYMAPATGRSLLPTIGCYIQMLRPGVRTQKHRQTSSAVYIVFEGSGFTVIDDVRYDWEQGDVLVIAPGARHAHGNEGRAPAILFSIQDVPLLRGLGLYREEGE
ncbi:MAG TPA: cupin domain-containing protein [Candidatus Acidoferrales bacterium]|nr:cupin domain-containing protein [Candidatus Acidoferrales bacterium]